MGLLQRKVIGKNTAQIFVDRIRGDLPVESLRTNQVGKPHAVCDRGQYGRNGWTRDVRVAAVGDYFIDPPADA